MRRSCLIALAACLVGLGRTACQAAPTSAPPSAGGFAIYIPPPLKPGVGPMPDEIRIWASPKQGLALCFADANWHYALYFMRTGKTLPLASGPPPKSGHVVGGVEQPPYQRCQHPFSGFTLIPKVAPQPAQSDPDISILNTQINGAATQMRVVNFSTLRLCNNGKGAASNFPSRTSVKSSKSYNTFFLFSRVYYGLNARGKDCNGEYWYTGPTNDYKNMQNMSESAAEQAWTAYLNRRTAWALSENDISSFFFPMTWNAKPPYEDRPPPFIIPYHAFYWEPVPAAKNSRPLYWGVRSYLPNPGPVSILRMPELPKEGFAIQFGPFTWLTCGAVLRVDPTFPSCAKASHDASLVYTRAEATARAEVLLAAIKQADNDHRLVDATIHYLRIEPDRPPSRTSRKKWK